MDINQFLAISIVGFFFLAPGWWFCGTKLKDTTYYANNPSPRTVGFWGMLIASLTVLSIAVAVAIV